MKSQEKEEGVVGAGGGAGGGLGSNKSLPKKKKDLKTGPQVRKTPAAKKREATKEQRNKDVKRKKEASATMANYQQTKSKEKSKKDKMTTAGGTGADKKMKKSSEVKKKKSMANGAAKDERRRKDEASKEGNVAGSAVASNGWGFGTEVLTCLPRRVASLNAMAKVHIMYENETNRSTAHTTANSNNTSGTTSNSQSVSNHNSSPEVVPPPASTGSSQPTTEVDTDSDVTIEAVSTNNGHSSPRVDRMMMTVAIPRCRRMASLNAQAILAASLCHDEKRPKKKEPPAPPVTPTTASGPSGIIKIEDNEDEEKTTTVEEEEIVQIVHTTKIRRRKMKTSKSPATPRAIKPKAPRKTENLDDDAEDLIDLGVSKAEQVDDDVKVDQEASATVTQAQQVTRTFTFSATSTGSAGLSVNPGPLGTSLNPVPLARPSLMLSQQQTVPIQNQATSFSYAATVNAQNPQGQTQMQGGTVYMANMNMANVNPGYTTIVTTPHFTVQPTVQPTAATFGIPAYYQVQPLIHKPIAFHPNGAFVGGQNAAGAHQANPVGPRPPAVQSRTPARNIVVQVPSTRQTNQATSQQNSQGIGACNIIPQQPPTANQQGGRLEVNSAMNFKTQSPRTNGISSIRVGVDSEAAGGSAGSSGRRAKMQGPSASASGLGSAVAKCERSNEKDKERKSGLLTGIKSDLLIKNSPGKRKFPHGWSWLGEPFLKKVCTSNEQQYGYGAQVRVCYAAMRHQEGDIIRPRDCVLLKSGPRVIDLPFVAKVGSLWQTPDGDMMISLLWYYRPEHTEQGRRSSHMEDEIFASKHCDANSVACIEDKCYVLSFAEYCRYRAKVKQLEEGLRSRVAPIVPPLAPHPRQERLPDPGRVSADLVFFCRKVYDYRQKRILKNPTVQLPTKEGNSNG